MIRAAFTLTGKDLRHLFRARETWLWAFVMPIVFFYFIGTVTGGFSSHGPSVEPVGLAAPADSGFLADRLAKKLEGLGYRVDRVDEAKLSSYTRRIAVPTGFTDSVLAGKPVKVSFRREGGGMNADYDTVRVQRAVFSLLADVVVAGGKPSPADLQKLDAAPHNLTLSVVAAGKRPIIPSGFQQAVPGTLVMFVLLVMFTSGGITLLHERTSGILRRLASSPMSRGSVVLAKWLSRMSLGLVQIAFGMAVGTLLFKVDWGPNLPMIVVILVAYGAAAALGGMTLANFGRTEGQVVGLGVILSNILAAIGGCWWPVEITPPWAQKAALTLPTGWVMGALHKLVSFGDPPVSVLPHLAALVALMTALGWVLARRFRFQ